MLHPTHLKSPLFQKSITCPKFKIFGSKNQKFTNIILARNFKNVILARKFKYLKNVILAPKLPNYQKVESDGSRKMVFLLITKK